MPPSRLSAGLLPWVAVCLPLCLNAQVVPAPPEPVIGSPNVASAEPPVKRPPTPHCTVPLFKNEEFADFTPKTFSYAPPAGCAGAWSKVVFTADFTVTEGRQYDRTAAFYLGHANIYYGTTAEPSANVSPSWHVERDVTDLSALFRSPQMGEADLGNFVGVYNGVTYNGIIYANAALEFYKVSPTTPAASVPEVVVPLPDAEGGAFTLSTGASALSQSVQLPRNVERVYLDVIAQSQSNDEFWYTCAPNDVANELYTCPGTAFREVELTVDGQAAGVAPIYPWIYTGGIDPDLWRPTPGVQSLNFKPYRVDLSPFAGLLSDGERHTLALSVFNADGYFLATANLLVFTDHFSVRNSGGIISNTLAADPVPSISKNLTTDASGDVSGTVSVTSRRGYEITGVLNTSHGRVETTVSGEIGFQNVQAYLIDASTYKQEVTQTTTATQRTTKRGYFLTEQTDTRFEYPLTLSYVQTVNPDGSFAVTTRVNQADHARRTEGLNGASLFRSNVEDHVESSDTINFDASGNFLSNSNRAGWQEYKAFDSFGDCVDNIVQSSGGLLTAAGKGSGCFLL